MEICLQFLCARYPQYFSLCHSHGEGHVFRNGLLKNETVIKSMHPLHVLLENIPEDFAVMLRNPDDGFYYLRAGVLCSSLGWNVSTKIGMQLRKIHEPIPDYKEKMEFSMDRLVCCLQMHLLFYLLKRYSPSQLLREASYHTSDPARFMGFGN